MLGLWVYSMLRKVMLGLCVCWGYGNVMSMLMGLLVMGLLVYWGLWPTWNKDQKNLFLVQLPLVSTATAGTTRSYIIPEGHIGCCKVQQPQYHPCGY